MTQWQINDNLDWTRGKHSYRFGLNTRRIDVSDYDLGEGTVPTAVYNDLAQFTYGAAYTESRTFPIALKERIAAGNVEAYAMDTVEASHAARHADGRPACGVGYKSCKSTAVVCATGWVISRISWRTRSEPAARPGELKRSVQALFPSTPLFIWQPRVSAAYRLDDATALHAGIGVFGDIIPAQIADLAATNAPYAPTFVGGLGGQVGGVGARAGCPASSADDATANGRSKHSRRYLQRGARLRAPVPKAGAAPTRPLAASLNTLPTGTPKIAGLLPMEFRRLEQQTRARMDRRGSIMWARAACMSPTRWG